MCTHFPVLNVEAGPRTTIEEDQALLAYSCKVPVLCHHLALTLAVDMEPARFGTT